MWGWGWRSGAEAARPHARTATTHPPQPPCPPTPSLQQIDIARLTGRLVAERAAEWGVAELTGEEGAAAVVGGT